ncbi:hypothetical protein ACK8P5_25575 (plasmid) [Paenibacillus sp. EC2-1]|uniref:hypothetical protein n=1 Tax=Paenibacillus sp. EC2-1 TaxID=3388665 RepID=UPI003BEF428B
MATIVNGSFLSPIKRGVKIPRVIRSQAATKEIAIKPAVVIRGILPHRSINNGVTIVRKINTEMPIMVIGRAVKNSSDSNRTYKILPRLQYGHVSGSRTGDNVYGAEIPVGRRVEKIVTGVGTYGVTYRPSSPTAPECKPVRRWPRDWNGSNMN